MSYAVKRLDLAEADALAAARWYDQQQSGLGDEFLNEIEHAVAALERNPLLYSVRFGDVRRAPVQRFNPNSGAQPETSPKGAKAQRDLRREAEEILFETLSGSRFWLCGLASLREVYFGVRVQSLWRFLRDSRH